MLEVQGSHLQMLHFWWVCIWAPVRRTCSPVCALRGFCGDPPRQLSQASVLSLYNPQIIWQDLRCCILLLFQIA